MKGLTANPGVCTCHRRGCRHSTAGALCGKTLPVPRACSKNVCDECRDNKRRARQAKWVRAAYRRDCEKFKARARARRAHNPGAGRAYAADYYRTHVQVIREKLKAKYATNPEKFKAAARRSHKNNLQRAKSRQAEYRARIKQLIVLGKRIEGSEPITGDSALKRRGRPIERTTETKIILAARLLFEGVRPYAMTDRLYPVTPELPQEQRAADRRRRFEALSKFLRKYRERIASERQRLAALREDAPNVA